MQIQKSPGGSIFPYYYKNGELFGVHFGSYFSDEDRLITMMKAEEAFFIKQNRQMGVWIDFYQSKLTDKVIVEFIELLKHTHHKIAKLGLVGCSPMVRWKINRYIKKTDLLSALPIKYFDDPEVAKTWLVSELE